ncbi:MAG: helix-turn-helix domain-containing protein [Nitrosomonas sp.]|nr:helix-turn-helix domain-containing protein [Nitrosomonas sp.]
MENNERLSPDQAAKYIGFEKSTLASWRCTNKQKIPYIKIGKKVFYYKSALDAFINSCKVTP